VRPRTKSELRRAEGATWGPRPGAQPANRAERPRMRLVGWKPLVKGTLRGFANVELPIGLRLIDCPIFVGPNGPGALADPDLWRSNTFASLRPRLISYVEHAIAVLEFQSGSRYGSIFLAPREAERRLQRAREILQLLKPDDRR
jgi:hypothetical protein